MVRVPVRSNGKQQSSLVMLHQLASLVSRAAHSMPLVPLVLFFKFIILALRCSKHPSSNIRAHTDDCILVHYFCVGNLEQDS